jgi:hypothetical protein
LISCHQLRGSQLVKLDKYSPLLHVDLACALDTIDSIFHRISSSTVAKGGGQRAEGRCIYRLGKQSLLIHYFSNPRDVQARVQPKIKPVAAGSANALVCLAIRILSNAYGC